MKHLFILFMPFLFSCSQPNKQIVSQSTEKILIDNTGKTQGTSFHIQYLSFEGEDYKEQIDSLLSEIDSSLSTYKKYSLISKINQGEGRRLDQMFLDIFYASEKVYIESNGDFDCSIAPLSNYWGFGFEGDLYKIDSAEVKRRLNLVDFSKIKIIDDSLRLSEGMQLDFNSIAQGYSVDVISDFLRSKQIFDYLIEIGGEVRCSGINQEQVSWKIGIDKPSDEIDIEERFSLILSLRDESLATSGNYRNFYIEDGVKYSHTINPKTGFPAKNSLMSVSVIHESCMYADAYATAFMTMGVKQTIEFLEDHKEIEAYLIYSENGKWKEFMTEGIRDRLIK